MATEPRNMSVRATIASQFEQVAREAMTLGVRRVHVRVQGYPDGRPAVDYTVNAEVGIPQITGRDDLVDQADA